MTNTHGSDSVLCLANLFELILRDPVRYHVVQSAINTSLLPFVHPISSASCGLQFFSKSTFKELLQEAKQSCPTNRPATGVTLMAPSTAPPAWKAYLFDPDEPEPSPHCASPISSRYDDPHLYEDCVDDTEADLEGLAFKVCAAKGLYMVNVGSFHIKANYPSQIIMSVDERVTELHFHCFSFVPSLFEAEGLSVQRELNNADDPVMARVLKFARSGSQKERHVAVEFLNFLNSKEYGISFRIDNISKVYFNKSTKHSGLGLLVFELKVPAKNFRKREIHSEEFIKRYYSVTTDWTKNQQASKYSRYYIVGESKELASMLANLASSSSYFQRVYEADTDFLQATIDNVFFSAEDDCQLQSESISLEYQSSPTVPQIRKKYIEVGVESGIGTPPTPTQPSAAYQFPINTGRVLLSPRHSSCPRVDGSVSPHMSTTSTTPPPMHNVQLVSTSPPISPNPWKIVPHARARNRNRTRANSSPCLITDHMRNAKKLSEHRSASPTSHSPKSSPMSGSPRTASPRTASPRTTAASRVSGSGAGSPRHVLKYNPKPHREGSPILHAENPGYSSESESTSPRILSKLPKLPPKPPSSSQSPSLSTAKDPLTINEVVVTSVMVTPLRTYSSVVQGPVASPRQRDPPQDRSSPQDHSSPHHQLNQADTIADSDACESKVSSLLFKASTMQSIASDSSSDDGGGCSSSSGGELSSDGMLSSDGSGTQSSDGSVSDPIVRRFLFPQAQRVPKINISQISSQNTVGINAVNEVSNADVNNASQALPSMPPPVMAWSSLCAPLVVLSPRSSSSSSSPSTNSPASSPPLMEQILSPRPSLLGPTVPPLSPRTSLFPNPVSPRGAATTTSISQSPRNYNSVHVSASPRNLPLPLVFGSNPLSPRNYAPSTRAAPPRTARTLERKSSQLSIIPESPSSNYRAVNYLSEDEKLVRFNILQVLIQIGVLDGDPNDYPVRNIHQSCTPTPSINHKLGVLHKKISSCFLDYLNFTCPNGLELENKIYDKYVHLYINGIDSDSDDDERHARRRRLWNVGNSGKDSYRTSVELINWLQYEAGNLPVFYSLCREELMSRDFVWHCRKCRNCVDWQYFHCNKCEKCVWGVHASDPHVCDKKTISSTQLEPNAKYEDEPPIWQSMVAPNKRPHAL